MQCITAREGEHVALVYCLREKGHDGVHVGEDGDERVQWKDSESYKPRVHAATPNPWEHLLPEQGTDVSVGFARRAGTIDGQLDAVIVDDGGPRAIRLEGKDWRTIVRWDAIETLQWFKAVDDE